MPYKFKLGEQGGVCSYEVLDSKNKVLLKYDKAPCLQGMNFNWEGAYREDIKNYPNAKKLRHDIRCKHADDLPGLKLFINYLFSPEDSPYREYIKYFEVEYDDEDRPVSFICNDIDAVHLDAFSGVAVALRIGYESPGSLQVYECAINYGLHPGMAMFIMNVARFQLDTDTFNRKKLIPTPCCSGSHGILSSIQPWDFGAMVHGIRFSKREFMSTRNGGAMMSTFYYQGDCTFIYDEFVGIKVEYTGAFKKYYDYIQSNKFVYSYYSKTFLPLEEIFSKAKKVETDYLNKLKKAA